MNSQKSYQTDGPTLYVVPTPIGNLEDMTYRAVRILGEVDLIAAEDTRQTMKLCRHFGIETKLVSYHEHNKHVSGPRLIEDIEAGKSVAVVSDAGMPGISDPGSDLVRLAIQARLPVVVLPGANAALTALVASGLATERFLYYGFLPRKKKDQIEALEELNQRPETVILYESPHRLKEVLKNMGTVLGDTRKIVLCRELTKRYEEFIRGTLSEVLQWAQTSEIRGEFCLIAEGNSEGSLFPEEDTSWNTLTIQEHVQLMMEEHNLRSKEAIKEVAKVRELKKQEVYAAYHEID